MKLFTHAKMVTIINIICYSNLFSPAYQTKQWFSLNKIILHRGGSFCCEQHHWRQTELIMAPNLANWHVLLSVVSLLCIMIFLAWLLSPMTKPILAYKSLKHHLLIGKPPSTVCAITFYAMKKENPNAPSLTLCERMHRWLVTGGVPLSKSQ